MSVQETSAPVSALAPPLAAEQYELTRRQVLLRVVADNGVVVAFAALFLTLSIASGSFLTKTNLLNVLEANADVGIVACASTIVVVAGGLDLSIAAIYAFSGVVAAEVALEVGVVAGLTAGIVAGAALGALNGLMVTVGRVNTFIATLASGIVLRSLAGVISGGSAVTPDVSSGFTDFGRAALFGVRYSVWIFALTALITGLVLSRGRFGRQVAVIGVNPVAARLSGVAVQRVRLLTFVISGLAAGVAGVLIASRAGQGSADTAVGFELPVIAAIAIGGTSFSGGEGAVWRTVVGVLFIGLIYNGMNLLDIDPRYQQLVLGALVLVALAADLGRRSGGGRLGSPG